MKGKVKWIENDDNNLAETLKYLVFNCFLLKKK